MPQQRRILVVTGASRGLGRSIAQAFCRQPHPWHVLLIARTQEDLEQTKQAIFTAAGATKQHQCDIQICVADLANLDLLETIVNQDIIPRLDSMIALTSDSLNECIFVNNAGSLGPIGPCVENCSLSEMKSTIDFNVTSALWLSARIAKWFKEHQERLQRGLLINISSLVAIQAFPSLGLYSAGKAARDQYHAAMAQEVKGGVIQTLNYAPGPLETTMTTDLRQAPSLDDSLKPHYAEQLVDPDDSAQKLVELVQNGKFESGQHVDYYDLLESNTKEEL